MTELENEADVRRDHHREAETAAAALRTALSLNGLPSLPSLDAAPVVEGLREGGYVYLGGCNARTAQAIADTLMLHARWTGRVLPSSADVRLLAGLLDEPTAEQLPAPPPHFPKELST
ncbi:hypothetical protein ACIQI7_33775 [Kitasatospora sp. NPDC092039]|uniref:hypothetical protein n=1 Tax=Kitasatospora sp. NPDC092039 TaxID=3364086 RepID=UPI0037F66086